MKHLILLTALLGTVLGLTLDETNHVVLRGEISSDTVGPAMVKMGLIASNRSEVFLVLVSGGGSVRAGNSIIHQINYLQENNVTISCIATYAASMAFSIFQSCSNRYVTSTSILMQHQMSVEGIGGPFENIYSYISFMNQLEEANSKLQSERLGMSLKDFKEQTEHDWWLLGSNAVTHNVADSVTLAGCDPDLYQEETDMQIESFFGTIKMTYSSCPMVEGPLTITLSGNNETLLTNNIKLQVLQEARIVPDPGKIIDY